ncbi:hypothetical protein W02_16790 [Nitrospira sp. KM1]|uniref:hypothetical protein n=1 Tax=Nitrospira sp. KM1 TaxID=1936990 RepID=UPI0013A76FE9|nr:hypothetical protein [Nitrospira sp. KM1]BCA54539.1 hypothetical protein W02_16790 [Nitrospira sp. KM1]
MTPPSLSKMQLRVSDTAIEVSFRWKIAPPYCRVRLYRTPTDPHPVLVNTPMGYGTITLQEPRTLYFEFINDPGNITVYTESWREPQTTEPSPDEDSREALPQ